MNPTVTVVVPTYNRPKLVQRALRSILAQTFQDFEIIVVDDGLKERAKEAVAEMKDPRITYLANETSSGACVARNKGIDHARGKYVAFLDDDDEWLPTKLEKQVEALEREGKDVGLAFTGVALYDNETGKHIVTKVKLRGGRMNPFAQILYRNVIWTGAIMVRRELFEKERFDPSFPKNQEWDLLLRLLKITDFVSIPEPLLRLNLLGEGEHMGGKQNNPNIIRGNYMIRDKHMADFLKYPKALARLEFFTGTIFREIGDFEGMKKAFAAAWKNDRMNLVYLRHYVATFLGEKLYRMMYGLKNT